MLDRADCADFGCHNSIRLETKHFLNTLALTFISFSGRFVFAMQKHYLFFCERSSSFKLDSNLLSCSRFHGHHTSDNINHHVEETLAYFEVAKKISHIVTDTAANTTKAFAIPGYISDEGTNEDGDSVDEEPECVDGSRDMREAISCKHHPCFTNTLQLVVKDGLSRSGQLSR